MRTEVARYSIRSFPAPGTQQTPKLQRYGLLHHQEVVERFLTKLRPLLRKNSARSAWLFGSHAVGTAAPVSDIDVIVVAPTDRIPVERFRDYLPAILEAGAGVDLFVYTSEEFEQMQAEEHPFPSHAMKSARLVHVG